MDRPISPRGAFGLAITILASLLTNVPIIILNFLDSINVRLGLIVIFTTIFSSLLAWLSNAQRKEVFAASAAFAAVQVVSIGGAKSTDSTDKV
jgi:hypothetical protein